MRTASQIRNAAEGQDKLISGLVEIILTWPIGEAIGNCAQASVNLLKLPDSEERERALWFILWAMGNDNIRWMRLT